MSDLNPLALDRTLSRVAKDWQRWRRGLRRGDARPLPAFEIHRPSLGKSCYEQVLDLHPADPLKQPLSRWVYRLAEQRINQAALLAREVALRVQLQPVQSEGRELPLAELRQDMLAPQGGMSERIGRRSLRLEALARHAENYRTVSMLVWERRQELARRMGLASPDAIEQPGGAHVELAALWLAETRETARSLGARDLSSLLELALDIREDHGWPARLTERSLRDLVETGDLLRGLQLDPGELPRCLGGASFMRGLARFGSAWHDAASPKHQPFVVAHDPYGLRRRELGACFAGLAINPHFAQKRLSLTGPRLAIHLRGSAVSLLIASRMAALRVLLRGAALSGAKAFSQAFEEHAESALGVRIDPRLSGVLVALHVDDGARFGGLLLAAELAHRLQEEHDEDWFRNPRSIEYLRAELGYSPEAVLDVERARTGLAALKQQLHAHL